MHRPLFAAAASEHPAKGGELVKRNGPPPAPWALRLFALAAILGLRAAETLGSSEHWQPVDRANQARGPGPQ